MKHQSKRFIIIIIIIIIIAGCCGGGDGSSSSSSGGGDSSSGGGGDSSSSSGGSSSSSGGGDGSSSSGGSSSSRLILLCHQSVFIHYVYFKRPPMFSTGHSQSVALLFVNHNLGCLYCFSNIRTYIVRTPDIVFCSSKSKASVTLKLYFRNETGLFPGFYFDIKLPSLALCDLNCNVHQQVCLSPCITFRSLFLSRQCIQVSHCLIGT